MNTGLDLVDKDELLKIYPNSEFSVENDVSIFFMGINHPMMNIVCNANFSEQEVEEKVNIIIDQIKRKKIPFIWFVGALSKPYNLGEYLVKEDLMKIESPKMYLNLKEINEIKYQKVVDQSNIKVTSVSNPKEEEQWIGVCVASFDLDGIRDDAGRVWNLYFKFCDAYIATLEGKAVGASMVFYGAGVVGIYNVGVCPEYRNRGIGTAITMAPLLQAKKMGYEISILVSSELGFKVYSQIGYKECCKFGQYIHIPQ